MLRVWGGAAAILFAVAFTIPTTLYDKFTNFFSSREIQIAELQDKSRAAVAAIAALRMEEADHFRTSPNPQDANLVQSNYDYRIYNLTISNIDLFKRAAEHLQSNDLYGIGSTLSLAGEFDLANSFYEMALAGAKSEKVFQKSAPTIFREMGTNNAQKGDINRARYAFGEALKILATQSKPGDMSMARDLFIRDKSELASAEVHKGNLLCGLHMANNILPEMQRFLAAGDRVMRQMIPALQKDILENGAASQSKASDCFATPD